jgi:hypothetical protein
VAKICRGFDSIASNDDLILKITSKVLSQLPAHILFESIINNSFRRSKEFEITQVLKGTEQEHASSPEQRSKILRSALAVEGELITPTLTREKLTAVDIARKNCFSVDCKELEQRTQPGASRGRNQNPNQGAQCGEHVFPAS